MQSLADEVIPEAGEDCKIKRQKNLSNLGPSQVGKAKLSNSRT
jgi:hypothetical protein